MKIPDIPQEEEARLETLRSLNILDTPPEERFDRLTRIAKELFGVSTSVISLVDENRQWFKSCIGLNISETTRDISFCGHAINDEGVFVIPDATLDERFADNPLVLNEPNIRFYAGYPLKSLDGRKVGTLCIIDQKPRSLSEEKIEIFKDLGSIVERELTKDLVKYNSELLQSITKAHTEFIDLVEPSLIFERFLDVMLSLTESEYGFIGEVLYTSDKKPYLKTLSITNIAWNQETRKYYEENVSEGMEFRNLKTLFGQVMVTGESVISNQPAIDHRRGGLPEGHPPLEAFLGIPIYSGDSMIGMLGIANRPTGYDNNVEEFLQPLLLTCGNFIRMIRGERKILESSNALNASENRAQAVLESTHDAIITINDNGIIETVNIATEQMFGYETQELIGKNINFLMPEPYHSHHDTYLRNYLETGLAKVIGVGREVVGLRKDGSEFPIDLAVTEFFITSRRLFSGIIRDISDRKIAQEKVEDALALLKNSNDNMLTILNESRQGIIMINKKGRVIFVSRSCEIMLQQSQDSLLEKPWEEVCPLTGDQKHKLRAMFTTNVDDRTRISSKVSMGGGRDFWMEIEVLDDPRNDDTKILFIYDMTEVQILRTSLNTMTSRQMIGNSRAILEMLELFYKLAKGDWTVLIEGETGVGKEMVAQGLHSNSDRRDKPFIAVNCGGISDSLLTNQLFGHRRGAFTSAFSDQEGLFEAANGGTIFLDEIGELSMEVQKAMLRVIQEREIVRVGETKPRSIDIRIIAATNRDLTKEVEAGRFREDLLYRIRVAKIRVPPLRERLEDISLLVKEFCAEISASSSKQVFGVAPAAMKYMSNYYWPGNVRELRNVIESASITCSSRMIQIDDLPTEIKNNEGYQSRGESFSSPESPPQLIALVNDPREQLLQALRQANGNRSKAGKLLGISRATFYRRLQKYGLDENAICNFLKKA